MKDLFRINEMGWRKIVLYLIAAIFGTLLVLAWQKEHKPQDAGESTISVTSTDSSPGVSSAYKPESFSPSTQASEPAALPGPESQISSADKISKTANNLIRVKTDVLDVTINKQGGDLIGAKLMKYPVSIDQPNVPVDILSTDPDQLYVTQSGLLDQENKKSIIIPYQSSQSEYQLANDQKVLQVKLFGQSPAGLKIEKTYTFNQGQYAIKLNYKITNPTDQVWEGFLYHQITRGGFLLKTSMHSRSYTGVSISSPQIPYEKLSFKQLTKTNIDRQIKGGWLAMQQQYFLSTWITPQDQINRYFSHVLIPPGNTDLQKNIYTVGYFSPPISLKPGESFQYQNQFYVGPELPSHLKTLAPNLDRTIDYGWLWFISKFIFVIMQKIYSIVGNWGWSIVIITLLVRGALYWFSARSYRSMAKMREAQPRIQALKERFGDDRQGLSKATMELYRKEKINPMGGCLPMIVQVPVFFALYYVLVESVELRQAPFILWIKDLSVHDPYYVLPILMGLSMLAQQKISPPPPDPTQAKMMMLLPLVFTVFFLSFPAGLVLYWLTNNCATILQQWYVMRSYNPKTEREKERKKKKKNK